MAYTSTPNDLFPGMTYAAGALTIPISSLTSHGLDAAKSDPTTGDARSVAYALVARCEEWFSELASDDRPKAFTAAPRLGIGVSTGDFPDSEKTQLTVTAYRVRPEGTVEDEPAAA